MSEPRIEQHQDYAYEDMEYVYQLRIPQSWIQTQKEPQAALFFQMLRLFTAAAQDLL